MNDHLGGSVPTGDVNTWMPDVWGYLTVRYGIASMLDVGCGYGYTVKWFSDIGIDSLGIDGDCAAVDNSVAKGRVMLHDFQKPITGLVSRDLAWSAEFLEHVEERFIPNFMGAFQRCRYVCATHALPGQSGHHHVNEKSTEYWVAQFLKYGFHYHPDETKRLRKTDRFHAAWGRKTLCLFENKFYAN